MRYVCVAGRTVRGDRAAKRSSLERYSHNSYAQACPAVDVAPICDRKGAVLFFSSLSAALLQGCHFLCGGLKTILWSSSIYRAAFSRLWGLPDV